MKARSLLLLVFAAGSAIGTAYIARGWLEAERGRFASNVPEVVEKAVVGAHVLVADRFLPMGAFVREDDLRWQPWPEGDIPEQYVLQDQAEIAEFVDAVVRSRMVEGEPISRELLAKPGDRGFLAAVLVPGMRAISVDVDRATGNAGLIFPGDRVDLVLTHEIKIEYETDDEQTKSVKHAASETVVSEVRVLAVDQYLDVEDGEAVVAKTATLEVTSKQAEVVAVAAEMGTLSIILRSLALAEDERQSEEDRLMLVTNPLNEWNVGVEDPSYTWDSDASALITPPFLGGDGIGPDETKVEIARGAETETVTVDKAGK